MRVIKAQELERITKTSFRSDIPFSYEKGSIIVGIIVAGEKKYFIIDSGAGTLIDKKILSKFKYKNLGRTKYSDAYGKKKKLQNIQVSSLKIGEIEFCDIVATVSDFEGVSKVYPCFEREISGIIGYNIISKAVWDVNFLEKNIVLSHQVNTKNKKESLVLNFDETILTRPLLNMRINEIMIEKVTLDLGSNGAISLPYQFYDQLNTKNLKTKQTTRSSFFSGVSSVKLKFGNSRNIFLNEKDILNSSEISLDPNLANPLIGTKFLENYLVTVDGPNRLLMLSNYSHLSMDTKESFGVTFSVYNSALMISSIIEESIAFKSGLKINDKMLKINGIDLVQLTTEEYCEYLQNDVNEFNHLDIRLEREGEIIELVLKK
jgi:predicted aspartyl protease